MLVQDDALDPVQVLETNDVAMKTGNLSDHSFYTGLISFLRETDKYCGCLHRTIRMKTKSNNCSIDE